jgi:hypothetical protein
MSKTQRISQNEDEIEEVKGEIETLRSFVRRRWETAAKWAFTFFLTVIGFFVTILSTLFGILVKI